MEDKRSTDKFLARKPEEEKQFGSPRPEWEDDIKMDNIGFV
jgi:hypothetical protein